MKEISCEKVKNSIGETSVICHYIIDDEAEASMLPSDAPLLSDALCRSGGVYIKFESGWSKI